MTEHPKEYITLRVLVANEYGEFPDVAGKTVDVKLELTKKVREALKQTEKESM